MVVHLTVNHGNGALPQRRHDFQGEEVRRRVKETSGIDLRWEIRRIGKRKEDQA